MKAIAVSSMTGVIRHPSLWLTAIRQARLLANPRWWREWPFFPGPPDAYMHFRMITAYGDSDAVPDADDVVTYLRWCRNYRLISG